VQQWLGRQPNQPADSSLSRSPRLGPTKPLARQDRDLQKALELEAARGFRRSRIAGGEALQQLPVAQLPRAGNARPASTQPLMLPGRPGGGIQRLRQAEPSARQNLVRRCASRRCNGLRRSPGAGNPFAPPPPAPWLRADVSQPEATPLAAPIGRTPLGAIAGIAPDRHTARLALACCWPRPACGHYPRDYLDYGHLLRKSMALVPVRPPRSWATVRRWPCFANVRAIPTSRSLDCKLQDITGRLRIKQIFRRPSVHLPRAA